MAEFETDGMGGFLGAFESARVTQAVKLERHKVSHLLLALDRSNQDREAVELTAAVAKHFGARVSVIFAEGEEATGRGAAYAEHVAGELRAAPHRLEAELVEVKAPLPSHQILTAQARVKADLVIVPAPYLRDIGLLGDESLSSPVDMLIAESPVPLLLVRKPHAEPARAFSQILVTVSSVGPQAVCAAEWALSLLHPGGELRVLAVADETVLGEAARLLGETAQPTSEMFERAETRLIGGLNAALQHYASDHGINLSVDVKVGKAVPLMAEATNASQQLVCVGAPKDRTSPEFHRMHDLLLRAQSPVLIV
jgi:nucleotide-binding universal stress UspA family protein